MQTKRHFNPVKSVYTLSFAALGACWGAAKVNYSLAAKGLYCYLGAFKDSRSC